VQGLYDAGTGEIILASAGHPLPLLRRTDGRVATVLLKSGRLLGYDDGDPGHQPTFTNFRFVLEPGETLILYTDGFTEARSPDRTAMFGLDQLQAVFEQANVLALEACADRARAAVEQFTQTIELQDDLTLMMIRRL
jgi:serine phosphatase RsbU (regulator of sigma subunit)